MKSAALAALCCAGAFTSVASAQSGLTLWGITDAWIGRSVHKSSDSPTTRQTVLESGGAQVSRWGLKGTEDLGGGLAARFVLEQGFGVDTGAISKVSNSEQGFNRASYVALAGAAGEVRLGRMLTAFDALRGSTNHLYDSSGFASTGQVWSASTTAAHGLPAVIGSDYMARGNNTAYYATPNVGPFRGSIGYSADEGASTATLNPRIWSGHMEYAAGPLRIGYGYQSDRYSTGKNNFQIVAGHYNFGPVRMVGAVQRQTDERVPGRPRSNEWEVGFDASFGASNIAIGYASAFTWDRGGIRVIDARGLSLMATYNLSARTRIYAGFRKRRTLRADRSVSLDASRIGTGVMHRF
ncbi:porin [Variovorax sp. YR216]|uniref:porin n=1 Tax=Variovorax sp. YR216 TaxID=1882828 RepID=UPI00089B3492|nr:porin [Variovorax sp. YR216]SEA17656.1 Outer membrane protein (porin) [Variovorax sp. YR216]